VSPPGFELLLELLEEPAALLSFAAAAAARIDHGDLAALLYAQGFRREEFVEG